MLSLFLIALAFTSAEGRILKPSPRFATPCVTPNQDAGICIEIQKCRRFMEELASGRNDSYPFILESRCGPLNEDVGQPKVCCGRYTNFIYYETSTTSTTPKPTPCTTEKTENAVLNAPFPTVCGNESLLLMSRIFGGEESGIGEFPWMARLRHRRKDGLSVYGCAGFLISEKFVLTAAHCLKSKEMEPYGPVYQVQLGEHDTETDPDCTSPLYENRQCADKPQLLKAAKAIIHPEYSNNIHHHNDIALIPLKEPAVLTDFVYPICLAQDLSDTERLWLSGWGKTERKEKSTVKLRVDVPRVNTKSCANLYKNVNVNLITSMQFCAGGENGRDSCSGDSGGPIMVNEDSKWYAEGIVSFGMGCGLEYWPGIYTSIPPHIPWIRKMMNRYLRVHDRR